MRGLLVLLIACSSTHEKTGPEWALEAESAYNGWNGTPLNLAASFAAAEKACALDDALGCAMLGLHYQDGRGAPWDHAKAVATYDKACRLGSGTGCYNLESMYVGGHGVVVDKDQGKRYRDKARAAWAAACHGSAPRWCTNLAFLEYDEPTPDLPKILALDQRACDAGVLVGCSQAVRVQIEMKAIAPAAYLARLDELCGKGDVGACGMAGMNVFLGEDGIAKDEVAGEARLAAACDQHGDAQACYQAALAEQSLQRLDDVVDKHYAAACDRGFGKGCVELAARLHKTDLAAAVKTAERACMIGQVDGCGWAAVAYRDGQGVAQNRDTAKRWLHEACSMGDGTSCGALLAIGEVPPVPADVLPQLRAQACASGIASACAK